MLPQLSLRTVLWLFFALAIGIGWGWERWGYWQLEKNAGRGWPFARTARRLPSQDSLDRRATLERLAKLSDEELLEQMPRPLQRDSGVWLTEMARRGMVEELRSQWEVSAEGRDPWDDNVELLTALRRAEGKPDPLQITVKFVDRTWGNGPLPSRCVEGVLRNADIDHQPFNLSSGCDDRGGRHDRWRVELRDEHGQRVPDANYWAFMGGGIGTSGSLAFGQTGSWRYEMDPRSYIQPPRSGRYQLQLTHSNIDIVDEPDLTGLIVWKSEPIWVEVINREKESFDFAPIRAVLVTLLALLVVVVTHLLAPQRAEEEPRRFAHWGDLAACGLVIALVVGWWYDIRQLHMYVAGLREDSAANWTIVESRTP